MASPLDSLGSAYVAAGLAGPGFSAGRGPGSAPALNLGGAASPALVLDWNQAALDVAALAIAGPTPSSRLYALVGAALYDAWALFDPKAISSSQRPGPKASAPSLLTPKPPLLGAQGLTAASTLTPATPSIAPAAQAQSLPLRQAVMAVAAHNVLLNVGTSLFKAGVMPADLSARLAALKDAALAELRRSAPNLAGLEAVAVALGSQVSASINAAALLDGSNQQGQYADPSGYVPKAPGPGAIPTSWQPLAGQAALTPHWGAVQPFAIDAPALVPASILTPYDSANQVNPAFVAEMQQVIDLGANLTNQQKAIADFWEDGRGTSYPPGTWIGFTNDLIRERNLDLDQAVKLGFAVGQAVFDAGIATWATKYRFSSVRPISAIRGYFADTPLINWRRQTVPGRSWTSYIPTPPFPDVPSGHSTFSAAAATVLRNVLGSNLFERSLPQTYRNADGTIAPDLETLTFKTLSGTAEQAGFSRLLGGIHMNDGNWHGQMIGTRVGAIVSQKALALFAGGRAQDLYQQQFGTMAADVITGQWTPGASTQLEIYGLGGDDTLIAAGRGDQHLFGGDGQDTFRLNGDDPVYIRDLEPGERIEVAAARAGGLTLGPSSLGAAFTDLSGNGRLLARLDGQWAAADLTLATWA